MKYVIVYWTRYGNNKRIVDHLAENLRGEVQVLRTEEADPAAMPEADYYIFSAAAEAFRVQTNMRTFMKRLVGMEGRRYGIINTHAMKNRNWLKSMEKLLSKKKMVKVAEVDFAMGKDVESANGLQGDWQARLGQFMGKLA